MCLREAFLDDVRILSPSVKLAVDLAGTDVERLHRLLECKLTVNILAKYCHIILSWFKCFPMYIPEGYTIRNIPPP